jgi:hypothetical protein
MRLFTLFLFAAASDAPAGGGGSTPPAETQGGDNKTSGAKAGAGSDGDDKKNDPAKKLREEWKGKQYADIAAHHTALVAAGKHEEAAFFHDAVVKTFRDSKPQK